MDCKDILVEGIKLFNDSGLSQVCRLSIPFIKLYELDASDSSNQESNTPHISNDSFVSMIFTFYEKIPSNCKSWDDPSNASKFLTNLESYLGQMDHSLLLHMQNCFSHGKFPLSLIKMTK